ncbi:MAG: DNA-directed RNA polymerase subunit omega [candidate division Zixibacteria bacterium]|nr:DNA-directed RNA polymerase subunit omega [candidate division Zixibacteria bacterium]
MDRHRDETLLMSNLDKITLNHYEAVLVAAKRARYVNLKRLQQLQMMNEDSEYNFDYRKVTTLALDDLLNDRIKYVYRSQE